MVMYSLKRMVCSLSLIGSQEKLVWSPGVKGEAGQLVAPAEIFNILQQRQLRPYWLTAVDLLVLLALTQNVIFLVVCCRSSLTFVSWSGWCSFLISHNLHTKYFFFY